MHYDMNSTRHHQGLPIARRILLAFVAVCFLCAVTGAATLLHHHDEHGPADSQCQICYLLTVAAVGQIITLIALFMLAGLSQRRPCLLTLSVESADFLVNAPARAPPRR